VLTPAMLGPPKPKLIAFAGKPVTVVQRNQSATSPIGPGPVPMLTTGPDSTCYRSTTIPGWHHLKQNRSGTTVSDGSCSLAQAIVSGSLAHGRIHGCSAALLRTSRSDGGSMIHGWLGSRLQGRTSDRLRLTNVIDWSCGPRFTDGGVGRVGWGLPLGTIGRPGREHLLPQSRFLKTNVTKPGRTGCGIPDPLDDEGVPHCRSSQWCQHFNAWRNCHPVSLSENQPSTLLPFGFGPFYSTCHSCSENQPWAPSTVWILRTGFFFALDDTSFLCLIWSLKLLERPFSLPSRLCGLVTCLAPSDLPDSSLALHSYSDLPDLLCLASFELAKFVSLLPPDLPPDGLVFNLRTSNISLLIAGFRMRSKRSEADGRSREARVGLGHQSPLLESRSLPLHLS
jgi:hypothetical protein